MYDLRRIMNLFDVTEFDPLNLSSAESYVQSVMGPQKVNEIVATADVYAEKPVSNFNNTNIIRGKRRLETDTQSGSVKKLKPTGTSDIDKISRLSESPLCNPSSGGVNSDHEYQSSSSEISELKCLVVGLTGSMNNFCDIITKRMDDIETNIPIQIAKMIDVKVSAEMKKVKDQFQKDLKTVSDKVTNLEKSYADVVKQKHVTDDDKLLVVIRNFPESENENVLNKVNGLVRDGLRVKDVQAVSAERKKSYRQGIILASFRNISDKRKVMEKKAQLKDSRNYKDIFIEHSIPKNQRMINSSLRNIVQAIGDNKLEIKGTIVKPKFVRDRHEYNGSQKSTNNYEQLESQASNDNGESNRNVNGHNQSDRNFNNRGRGNYRGQNEGFIQNNRRGRR